MDGWLCNSPCTCVKAAQCNTIHLCTHMHMHIRKCVLFTHAIILPCIFTQPNARFISQGGAPLHYRDIHWFNAPYIFKYCLKMVTPVLSKVSKGQLVVNSSSKILSIQAHPRLHLPLQQPRRGGQDRRGSGQGARGVRRLPRPNGRHARLREGPRAGGLLQAAPRVGRYVRGDEEQSMMRPGNLSFSYLFGKRRVFMQ